MGAGEIVLTSIDKEGTAQGFDLELTKLISRNVSIPVVASGGAGSADDVYQVVTQGGADAVIVASILHYDYIQHHPLSGDFSEEGNIEFLKKGGQFSKIKPTSIKDIKQYLKDKGVAVRI